jgi:hypothetical protein
MRDRRAIFVSVLLHGAALGAWSVPARAERRTTALTLSGWPSAPRTERAMRATAAGIRFRAPAGTELAEVELLWRRNAGGCTVALHADTDGAPGAIIATAAIAADTGWVATPLSAALVGGESYHLVARCDAGARLGYVVDAERGAVEAGVWQLEDLRGDPRPRRAPASPLFALRFADGTWWGQPYRARARMVGSCGGMETSAVVVPAAPLRVEGVQVPVRPGGPYAAAAYTLTTADGAPLASPATLFPGVRYVVRVRGRSAGCRRLATLATDLPLGAPLTGFQGLGVRSSDDGGATWESEPGSTLAAVLVVSDAGTVVTPTTTTTLSRSGATTSTTTAPSATTTTLPPRAYRAPYADGYLGFYDSNTIPLWPQRMILMLGEANAQGPLIANAKRVAAAAGNADAKFIFYQSLTDMDSRCQCSDQFFYDSFKNAHPEWILKDASGNRVTTNNGIGRLFATDIGNPAYVDAWADWAVAAIAKYGWDGTFVDNVFRGNFSAWSAYPIDPRTGATFRTADYRADMLAALRRLRARYDARGKILVGNHSSAWDPSTFADPVVQQEILTMHGVEVEDCVFDWNGNRQNEGSWIAQLKYLDYANQHGVRTICNGPAGTIGDAKKRTYVLASYLLTKEGFSSVAEINSVSTWWNGLATDLGAPVGRYYCLDPAAGLARTASCPATGKVYARDWARGRVLVNPTAGTTVTVRLGETLLNQGTSVTSVTLAPGSGVVLVRP